MTKQEHINYWLTTAQRDIQSMDNLFRKNEYYWSLFVGHLSVEKLLKAFWVKNNSENTPPKTHNLLILVEQAGLHLDNKERDLLADVNEFNIESRYPDYKYTFYKKATKEFAHQYITAIREFYDIYAKKIG